MCFYCSTDSDILDTFLETSISLLHQQFCLPLPCCLYNLSGSVHFTFFSLEPNAYRSMVGRAVNSTQLAQDYTKLRTLLQSVRFYHRAHLYGPNAGRPWKNALLLLDE